MSEDIKRVSPSFIQELAKNEYNNEFKFLSPVNLKLDCMTKIELPELKWLNMDSEPQSTKVANTGQTVIVSGTWQKHRPRVTGGPLQTTYAFSQLHYHWGSDNSHGSEHSYDDKKVPLEMHAVFLKENCRKQEDALGEKDGAVVISYAYKLSDDPNPGIKLVCDELPYIPNPSQLIELEDPIKLTTFVAPFQNDYFVYWGSVRTNACKHVLLWILCRQPYVVSEKQLEIFRTLFTSGHQPILNNSRHVHNNGYEVFHVNPSAFGDEVLYKKTENNVCKKVLTLERIKEMKKRRSSHGRYLVKSKQPSMISIIVDGEIENNDEQMKKNKTGSKISVISNESDHCNKELTTTSKQQNEKFKLKEPVKKVSETNTLRISSKPKRQSYYRKFFSLQNKIDKKETEKYLEHPGKGDITVMSAISSYNDSGYLQRTRESLALQNNYSLDSAERDQNRKDQSLMKQLKSQYTEAKARLKNDDLYSRKKEESYVNSLKYINTQNMKKLQKNDFYSQFSDRISRNKETDSEDDERDKLGVIQENSMENWERCKKLKNDSKEVTFNTDLNVSAPDVSTNILCYTISSQSGQIEKNKSNKKKRIESGELDNDVYADCCEEINESNNNKTSTMKTNESFTSKGVQDVGINTMSLNELITALSEQHNYEAKKINKLVSITSKSNITFSGGDSNESSNENDYKTEENIKEEIKEYQKNKSKVSEIKKVISKKKCVSVKSISSDSSSTSSKSGSSLKSENIIRSKHMLHQTGSESENSTDNTERNHFKSISKHTSSRLPNSMIKENYSSLGSQSKERQRLCKITQSKIHSTNKSLGQQSNKSNFSKSSHNSKISSNIDHEMNSSQKSKRHKSAKSLKRVSSRLSEQSSKSREYDSRSQHSSLSQPSIRNSEKCHSTHASPNHERNEHKIMKKFINRPLTPTPTPDLYQDVDRLQKRNIISSINKTLTPKYMPNSSSEETETVSSLSLSCNASVNKICILDKNEKELKKKKSPANNKTNTIKSDGRGNKILEHKDSIQLLSKAKESSKIPMRKSILQKKNITHSVNTSIKADRPQSVSCSRQNNTRSKLIRPRTTDSQIDTNNNIETFVRSSISAGLKNTEDKEKNTFRMKPFPSKIPARRPASHTWKY